MSVANQGWLAPGWLYDVASMKRLGFVLLNILQWSYFGAWSFFWMSAATFAGLVFPRDPDVALSWARRYWGPGLIWGTRCTLVQHPGFVPRPDEPYIFVMNHQSMFDIVVAFVAIRCNVRFVAKKILKLVPFLGWYMSATGMVFIDRENHADAVRSLDEACDKIRRGSSIFVYPEGTRSSDGRILPFKKGPFVMAIQAGVPIVPVAIHNSASVLGRDSIVLDKATVHCKIGEPIPTRGLSLADRDQLTQKVREALIELHRSIGGPGGATD